MEALTAGWSSGQRTGARTGGAAARETRAKQPQPRNLDHPRLGGIGPTPVLSARSNRWTWSIQQRPPTDFRRS